MDRFTQEDMEQIESMTEEEFETLMAFIANLKRLREKTPT